jgi:type IV secretory pathway TrbD component
MTGACRALCLASPLTLYVTVTRRLVTMGAEPWYAGEYIFGLMVWLLAALALARFSVHKTQKNMPAYIQRKAAEKNKLHSN